MVGSILDPVPGFFKLQHKQIRPFNLSSRFFTSNKQVGIREHMRPDHGPIIRQRALDTCTRPSNPPTYEPDSQTERHTKWLQMTKCFEFFVSFPQETWTVASNRGNWSRGPVGQGSIDQQQLTNVDWVKFVCSLVTELSAAAICVHTKIVCELTDVSLCQCTKCFCSSTEWWLLQREDHRISGQLNFE